MASTTVRSGIGSSPPPVPPAQPEGRLPVTGAPLDTELGSAAALLGIGLLLMLAGRRRRYT